MQQCSLFRGLALIALAPEADCLSGSVKHSFLAAAPCHTSAEAEVAQGCGGCRTAVVVGSIHVQQSASVGPRVEWIRSSSVLLRRRCEVHALYEQALI